MKTPRQIKFRAWHKDRNIMLTIVRIDWIKDSAGEYCNNSTGYGESGHHINFKLSEVDLMQFTGLKDKNGTEIYEGDILSEGNYTFQVVWDQQWAKFKLESIGHYQYPEWNRGVKMHVIGDIYRNPELLKP